MIITTPINIRIIFTYLSTKIYSHLPKNNINPQQHVQIINQKIKKKLINSQSIFQIPQLLSYDAKEYYHFSEVVDEFCKNGWTILNQMF